MHVHWTSLNHVDIRLIPDAEHDRLFRDFLKNSFKGISGVFLILLYKFRCTYRFKIEIYMTKVRIPKTVLRKSLKSLSGRHPKFN